MGRTVRSIDESISAFFDLAFAPSRNPWRHLGGLAFLFLIVVVATGTIAYTFYDTSVAGAYESGKRLEDAPWYTGRLLRGLHRYGADAFLVVSVLHLIREAARGHFRRVRWYSWLTGVPLLWLTGVAGIAGFWLLWDERAIYSLAATAQWLEALPIAAEELSRNVLTAQALNDRFFSLIMFIHIGVPLILLAGVWIHVQRIALARLWPPASLTVGSLLMLSLLSLLVPAQSLGPADAGNVSATLSLDWFFMWLHPVMERVTPAGLWALTLGLTLVLSALPLIPVRRIDVRSAAKVDLGNCNGCSRCAADCPFGAIDMVPRTDRSRHARQPVVNAEQCAACGICVGSCPSATPFRSIEAIVSGIEMPDTPLAELRRELQQKLAAIDGARPVVVFACRQAGEFEALADGQTAVIAVECAAMVPPSFLEYATRHGAAGVMLTGCRETDCEYRLGDRWVRQRLAGEREPRLRAAAPRERLAVLWCGNRPERARFELLAFRRGLPPADASNMVFHADVVHDD
ncbi:MAG: cytochrome b N-terminal domain-containing protein [Burkholderiaceae bacterium]|nr:cytochrome b N-terminal domain-containing protein [Burkholderiaceae bacterium]